MTGLGNLTRRNSKLFFKDKGMFFTSLITPVILLVLYATFLAKVYRDSFASAVPQGFELDSSLIDATVGGQLISSLLAVCCITVAFCSNMLMVQDKVTGALRDITVTPVKRSTLAVSYYIATVLSTMLICMIATGAGFIYLAKAGWYLSAADTALFVLDVILLVLFGTALSSIINFFLSSPGADVGGGDDSERRVRLHMRRIHADIAVRGNSAACDLVPAGYIWHESAEEPCACRRLSGNGRHGIPVRGHRGDKGFRGLQPLLF